MELPSQEALLREKKGPLYSVFSALYIRNYRLLWMGNFLTNNAHWMEHVAIGWLMLELTGSPFMVGLVSFARGVPMLVLSPAAGVLIDRVDRRRFLIANQALFGIVSLALATLILAGLIAPWQLLAAALLSGTTSAMILPARQAMIPGLVGRAYLANAVALHSMCGSITRILGPSLAGALISFVGMVASFYLQAASALSALWMTAAMRTPPDAAVAARETVWQNLRAGFAYIRADRSVAGILILGSMISLFAAPYSSMLPVLARDVFGVDASGLGALMATMGAGALIGSLFLAAWSAPRRGMLLLASALTFSLAVVALALANSYVVACVAMAVIGISFAFNLALSNTLLHIVVPDALRGRVMSSFVMTIGLLPIGSLVVGTIAEVSGAPLAVGLGGGVCALSTVLTAILVPQLRALD